MKSPTATQALVSEFVSRSVASAAKPTTSRGDAAKQKTSAIKARHWHEIEILPPRTSRKTACLRCGVYRDPEVEYCACPEAIWK